VATPDNNVFVPSLQLTMVNCREGRNDEKGAFQLPAARAEQEALLENDLQRLKRTISEA